MPKKPTTKTEEAAPMTDTTDAPAPVLAVLTNRIEVAISFDTTGSMYPCLTQVRRRAAEMVRQLGKEIPGIRIAVIAHGDYCDQNSSYVTKGMDFTDDLDAVVRFIEKVGSTGGGDSDECYELVLHEAQKLSWTFGYNKALVMIGDCNPHEPGYTLGGYYGSRETHPMLPLKLNWRDEAAKLGDMGVQIYAVQALNYRGATTFYKTIAAASKGYHLTLDQFAYATEMLLAICYRQYGEEHLENFEKKLASEGKLNRNMHGMFRSLGSKADIGSTLTTALSGSAHLRSVPSGRFQVLDVDKDQPIKDFVLAQGVEFAPGRGFYQFMKTETIQGYKEIILMDKVTGDLFEGDAAREMLGIAHGVTTRLKPADLEKFYVFVQSTSYNRKLIGGYKFLYEVPGWEKAAA
jgi:hypothetical protein